MASDGNKLQPSYQEFYGGKATDAKIGIAKSFGDSQAMDFRKQPSQLTVLPGTRNVAAGNLSDLIQGIVQVSDGNRFATGSAGNFYRINTSNSVSNEGSTGQNGGAGIVYRPDTDAVYFSGQSSVSSFGRISANPTLQANRYAQSVSTDSYVTQILDSNNVPVTPSVYRSSAAALYTLKTAISEAVTDRCPFLPDIEPFYSIKVKLEDKGAGDWTLTLHDDANNSLASVTITNANLKSGQYNEFIFSSQIRALVKPNARTYHYHLTSTVAAGTIRVVTKDSLATSDFQLFAYRLVQTNNGLHPMELFAQYTCIGNERYLSAWEPLSDTPSNSEWQRHRLTFPPGYEVCGLSKNDEFLVIACERRTTSASINYQDGALFFWDGTAQTYNFLIETPMGAPQGIYTDNNITYMIINGSLYAWAGGKTLIKVRTFEGTDSEFSGATDTTSVYPNMMTTRRNILLMGYPSVTTNTSVKFGVYSWGSIEKNYPSSFGYSYVISPNVKNYSVSNGLQIGCVKNFNDTLYTSWKSDGVYGLDVVDNSSTPAPEFSWDSLIYDGGAAWKTKLALREKISFSALPAGVTITPRYKVDRGSWVNGTPAVEGANEVYHEVVTGRCREFQWGFTGTCTGTTSPTIINIVAEIDPLGNERDL